MKLTPCYVVWYWNDKSKQYRVGNVFHDKQEAHAFAKSKPRWQQIGIEICITKIDGLGSA